MPGCSQSRSVLESLTFVSVSTWRMGCCFSDGAAPLTTTPLLATEETEAKDDDDAEGQQAWLEKKGPRAQAREAERAEAAEKKGAKETWGSNAKKERARKKEAKEKARKAKRDARHAAE